MRRNKTGNSRLALLGQTGLLILRLSKNRIIAGYRLSAATGLNQINFEFKSDLRGDERDWVVLLVFVRKEMKRCHATLWQKVA